MLGKSIQTNKYWNILLLVGVITIIFGVVTYKVISIEGRNVSMLKGMIIGVGITFTAIGGIKLFQNKMSSAEKLKAKEIELKDERNIEILSIAHSISSIAATFLFALLAFIFVAMDYIVPAFISLAAIYIQLLAFIIGYKYFNNKM